MKLIYSLIVVLLFNVTIGLSIIKNKKKLKQNSKFECGIPNNNVRIVGGEGALPNEFPWMAGIYVYYHFLCGGSLITEQHVLTAAHCIIENFRNTRRMHIMLGMHNSRIMDGEKFKIKTIYKHPDYKETSSEPTNDIAILQLRSTVNFNEKIRAICLPSVGSELVNYGGKKVLVAGWGVVKEKGKISDLLRKVNVFVEDYNKCSNYLIEMGLTEINTNKVLCARDEKKDSCQGDSGGGLIINNNINNKIEKRYTIIGIVSFGFGCAKKFHPGIYTKVNEYLQWIKSII